jgi:hypothetical protein
VRRGGVDAGDRPRCRADPSSAQGVHKSGPWNAADARPADGPVPAAPFARPWCARSVRGAPMVPRRSDVGSHAKQRVPGRAPLAAMTVRRSATASRKSAIIRALSSPPLKGESMARVPFASRIGISLSAIAWFVLAVLFLLGVPVLIQLPAWMLAVAVGAALLLAWIPFALWRVVRRGRDGSGWGAYLRCAVASTLLLGAAIGFPVYFLSYTVEADPMVMPQATLSNGKRTVVFQGMVHIGAENFYKAVIYDLETALANGYRLYYEGVQPSTPEADQWFADTLSGGRDLAASYQAAASACGLHFQIDFFGLLLEDMKARPDRHLTADVTTAEMKAEFDRLVRTDPAFAAEMQKLADAGKARPGGEPDFLSRLIERQQQGSDAQKNLVGIICRGIFSLVLDPASDAQRQPIERVILDFRNERLAEQILADEADRIFITYGAKHLPGVVALLQQKDPRWKIGSVKWIRAIAKPEHFERPLELGQPRRP